MKRALLSIVGVFGLLVALYGAYDWRYWVRHFQSPGDDRIIFDFDWYEPRARIGDGPGRDVSIAAPGALTVDQAALDQVIAYARQLDLYAFIVAHKGVVQAEVYKDGFGPEFMFDTQSMHKGLLNIAFGLALDHGHIPSIDIPAATYITEWKSDARSQILIRDLLAGTSGLADPGFAEVPWSPGYRLFIGTGIDDMVIGVPAEKPPRTEYYFNHVNSQLLHAILVRATGMAYVDFLKKYLWQPVGNGAAQVRLDEPDGSARTVCCFQTTARSWLRLANLMLADGKVGDLEVLSSGWIKEVTTGTALNPKFGFHTHLGRPDAPRRVSGSPRAQPTKASEPFAVDDVRYLEGRGGQRTLWIPSKNLAVIRIGRINFAWDDAQVINPLVAGIKE